MTTIPLFKVHTPAGLGATIEAVFASGMIAEGEYVARFERQLADLMGSEVVTVNSGTSALTLAAHLIGLKPGDEVITTPMTCMATNEPFFHTGARLIWADVDPTTGNIDPDSVARCVTANTRAVVAVHWGGQPVEYAGLRAAVPPGIPIVCDAAHALGAVYHGRPVAQLGDYNCFSFQAIKHLTTGDGGALTLASTDQELRARRLRWFGLDRDLFTGGNRWAQDIPEAGFKFHMNNVAAAIGLAQLPTLPNILDCHRRNSERFDRELDSPRIEKLRRPTGTQSACWIYSLLVDSPSEFREHAAQHGVATDVVHVRNDRYSVFQNFQRPDSTLPGVTHFASHLMHVPVGWWVDDAAADRIIEMVNSFR